MPAANVWTFPFSAFLPEETPVSPEQIVSQPPHELVPVVRPALLPASAYSHGIETMEQWLDLNA